MQLEDVNRKPYGHISIFAKEKNTQRILWEWHTPNVVTYEGSDVFARALAGDNNYKATHVLGEHAAFPASGYLEGITNGLLADKEDTYATANTAPRSITNSDSQILTVSFSKTLELPPGTPVNFFDHNIVNFLAIVDDSAVDGDIFVAADLACFLPDGTKLVIARQIHPGIVKLASFSLFYMWSIRFL